MKISVITVCYNAAKTIRDTCASVRAQKTADGLEIEHIVVDGGSTDGTAEIVNGFGLNRMEQTTPSVVANGAESAQGGMVALEPGDTFDQVERYLRQRVSMTFENKTLGIAASIGSRRNANELAKHMAAGESPEAHKFAAKNIGALFERGVVGFTHLDKKAKPDQRWITRFVRVFSSFCFAGERFVATLTLKDESTGGRLYAVEAVEINQDVKLRSTPRGAMSKDLNSAPILNLTSQLEERIAYYVGDVNRTHPAFLGRSEPFSAGRAADLIRETADKAELGSLDTPHSFRWLSERDNGMYDALNKGVRMATGDVIGILNADDRFADENVLMDVATAFAADEAEARDEGPGVDAIYGDVRFVRGEGRETVRYYSSRPWKPWMHNWGYMPAHPTVYVRKDVFARFGGYKLGYDISADFEWMVRIFCKEKITAKYLSRCMVTMRLGGKSTAGLKAMLRLNRENVRANRENGFFCCLPMMLPKYAYKILGYLKKHE